MADAMSSQSKVRSTIIRPNWVPAIRIASPALPFLEDCRMSKELLKAVPFVVGLTLIALVAGLPSGCNDEIKTDAPPRQGGSVAPVDPAQAAKAPPIAAKHPKAAPVPEVKPLLKGWAKPAVAIVFSGEQHGYMEPCGCSVTQSGGLSRRGDFIRQLTEKGWPLAALDLGGVVKKDNQQNKIKYQVMLSALKDLGYKTIALGPEELSLERLEPGFLVTQGPQPGADPSGLGFVNVNVDFTLFKDAGLRPAAPVRVPAMFIVPERVTVRLLHRLNVTLL